jgi:acetyl-CoA/propionyl-CoA carboxylase carboxyl transferase subunit
VAAITAASRDHCPVVGIWHSGGARLQDGYASLDAVGSVFAATVAASGRIPQLSLVLGPAAGGAAYGSALTDVVITGPDARMFITGPDVVRSVTGQDVDMAALGGPDVHARRSGVVHVAAADEMEAYDTVRRLVGLLGHVGGFRRPERLDASPALSAVLPQSQRRAYDVRPLVRLLLDDSDVVELHRGWARNIVTTLGRLDHHAVGVVANNPLYLGGCLNAVAAEKAARFVRMCDAFGLPLIVLVDVPGYLPGVDQEHSGVIRRGAKLLHAFAEATVPRVTVVTRKAHGGAFIAMNSRSLGATAVYAWPGAEVAVMSARAAVRVLRRRDIAEAHEADREALVTGFAQEHEQLTGGLEGAVRAGVIDSVIDPAATRRIVASALAAVPAARGRHTNIPL